MAITRKARPFVKWAGGKTRVVSQLLDYFPSEFKSYYEPFLGGGSLYFSISPQKGRLNDMNSTLIYTYLKIRDNCSSLIKDLEKLQAEYYSQSDIEAKKLFYYERRSEFNATRDNTIRKASLFIFLNKTGFNGMYRENASGQYNIPFGKHENPLICDKDNLIKVSDVLKQIDITCGSYEKAVDDAKRGDLVYLDPPYAPLTPTSSFTEYQAGGFGDADQEKVRDLCLELDKKGCFVMVSNSTAPIIKHLYKEHPGKFVLNKISVGRAINSAGAKRGKIDEYLITNYNPEKGKYLNKMLLELE
jgi:DNA adenine methylase